MRAALDIFSGEPRALPLAGGTDLLVLLKDRLIHAPTLVSLARVEGLDEASLKEGGLVLGAMTPLWRLERWGEATRSYPALAEALRRLAAPPIRTAATIGGNLCLDLKCIFYNQSRAWPRALKDCFKAGGEVCHLAPAGRTCHGALAGETVGPLVAAKARLKLEKNGGSRSLPVEEFFTGDGLKPHVLEPGELLTGIELPAPETGSGTAYFRFSRRRALEFSQFNLTAAVRDDGAGRLGSARLIVGGICPRPIEIRACLEDLLGSRPTPKSWVRAAQGSAKEALTASRSPRLTPHLRAVLEAAAERVLAAAWSRALGGGR